MKKFSGHEHRKRGRILPARTWNDEGVASTVGTIMALMVFLSFLSLMTNSYVPVWMEDNESNHVNTVENQFGTLKWSVDNQILGAQITGHSDVVMYTPITLSAAGVPVFASPTAGALQIIPESGSVSAMALTFNYSTGSTTYTVTENSGGSVALYMPNRYFVQQTIIYENGAIIVNQSDGEVIRASPDFKLETYQGNLRMILTQVSIQGTNQSVAGFGTRGINTNLIYCDFQEYENVTTDVTLTITTPYGQAWEKFMTAYLSQNAPGLYTLTSSSSNGVYTVTATIQSVSTVISNHAYVDVSMAESVS